MCFVLFIRATFCVMLVCVCMCSVSWLIWLRCRLQAAIPTNASEKAQLTLTLTLTVTLTLTLTHFSPSPIPSPNPNSNPNPLHYPFRNVGIVAVGISAPPKLSLLAKWLARKTPLKKPFRGKEIISTKHRTKSVYDFFSLVYWFIVLLCVARPYMTTSNTPVAGYSLFVLKVPLNTNQPTKLKYSK